MSFSCFYSFTQYMTSIHCIKHIYVQGWAITHRLLFFGLLPPRRAVCEKQKLGNPIGCGPSRGINKRGGRWPQSPWITSAANSSVRTPHGPALYQDLPGPGVSGSLVFKIKILIDDIPGFDTMAKGREEALGLDCYCHRCGPGSCG